MCTNFDFLKKNKAFDSFSNQAIEAERSLVISSATAAIMTRRALELAVRWVYVNDDELTLPYRDNLSSLIHERSFKSIIEPGLFRLLTYIVSLGNHAVHTNQNVKRDEAVYRLEIFLNSANGLSTVMVRSTQIISLMRNFWNREKSKNRNKKTCWSFPKD